MPGKITKVLVANRYDSAVRVEKTCKRLGMEIVAVFTESDRNGLHVRLANEAYLISSYMNAREIFDLAVQTNCRAIHPGYGFLSEKPELANYCEERGIHFVGPRSSVVERMGNKMTAKQAAIQAGIPVLQATRCRDVASILGEIEELGMHFPVVVKAAAGGGGFAIEIVSSRTGLQEAVERVQAQAERMFGNSAVYVEPCLLGAVHIEVQIVADEHGNVIHLGEERDCSLQRDRQKVVEETPSPRLTTLQRQEICRAAVKLATAVGYTGIGTVEFLFNPIDGKFYFLEMNTRIQVEHAITEMVTGIDLVEIQFLIAEGHCLEEIYVRGTRLTEVKNQGWAMEVRIYPQKLVWEQGTHSYVFEPNPGAYALFEFGLQGCDWARLDTVLEPFSQDTPQIGIEYSNLLARLVVWGATRDEAVCRMGHALGKLVVTFGTNISLLGATIELEEFQKGTHHIQTLSDQAVLARIVKRAQQLEREELGRVLLHCQGLL